MRFSKVLWSGIEALSEAPKVSRPTFAEEYRAPRHARVVALPPAAIDCRDRRSPVVSPPAQNPPPPGDGRTVELLEPLGADGGGRLFRGRLKEPGGFTKIVAVKVVEPGGEQRAELGQRLRDEARLLAF